MKAAAIFAAAACLACGPQARAGAPAPQLMHWADLTGRPLPAATERIPYGTGKLQYVDLFLPPGAGPFRVVVMVHGGCWQSAVAGAALMNYAADDLRRRGMAVWNIEYRGTDVPGGGYPGTFQDVARAADTLRAAARRFPFRLDHIAALGHSAGGHLAIWLAARGHLPAASALRSPHPLPITRVVSLGGLPDLKADLLPPPAAACGTEAPARMAGPASPARPDPLADTSDAALLPIGVPQILINGGADPVAPPQTAASYAAEARRAGDTVRGIIVPGQGHVEEITPGTAAWAQAVAALGAP